MSLPLHNARIQCAECLRLLRLGARQASTSTFQQRRGERSDNAAASSAAPWQQRSQATTDQRRRPDVARISRPSDSQRPRQSPAIGSRNPGGSLGGSPRAFGKPEASKTKFKEKDSDKAKADEAVNVNFSQGSALAAFLSKSPAAPPRPSAALSRSPQRSPRQASPRVATASQRQAVQTVNRRRPPFRRMAARPTTKVEISSMTSVNSLSRILGLKLRRSTFLVQTKRQTS